MGEFSRQVPKNITAEKHLLGAILLDDSLMNLVGTKLVDKDFFSARHGQIWAAMQDLYAKGKPIDFATLAEYMKNEEESVVYIVGLVAETGSTYNVEEWAKSIKGASRRRAIMKAGAKMVAASYEEVDPNDAESRAKEILMDAIGDEDHDQILSPEEQAKVLKTFIEAKKTSVPPGILTGYPTLDNMCGGGLRRGDLIVVAARTSVGKSTFAENIAENVAFGRRRVLFVSIEMSPEQIMYRYAIRAGDLSRGAVEFGIDNDADKEALAELVDRRSQIPFHLMNSPSATTTMVRSAISRIKMQEGNLDLVVIDYLQLLKDRIRQEERLNIGEMTSSLKAMAREFEVPILLLSQLNRNIEHRGGEPVLADLRESGRIEEDSDVVILLWKTEKPDSLGNQTRMKIAKNRQGATGEVKIHFHAPSFKFTEKP